ncbi:O-mycaminosyltylonolide 6-deoxyallosyltransferase [Ensifer sp. M14]|uniref:glycosyltransferase n=1 Tax=Ensifer sp. M14 TaxID=2203782 RepID=UPI000E1D161B|nr:glycosyltransferase [Ensifer sp. M14]RDL47317.1 O-mycaminosyltylonolide 6-deoxyallosyltransferase [Ensifer sp. M14]
MRVAIHTFGTRGDIQPYLALAKALHSSGHTVQLAGPQQFERFVHDHAIPFAPLPGDLLSLLDAPKAKNAIASGAAALAGFKLLGEIRPHIRKLLEAEWLAAHAFAPDIMVYHPKSLASPHIAERLQCASVLASPLPILTPTSEFPSPMLPFRSLGPLNRASHILTAKLAAGLFSRQIGSWRKNWLGLSVRTKRTPLPDQTLYGYSRHLVPVPEDWGPDVHVTGTWELDSSNGVIGTDLDEFLSAGPAPVYVGFGSMPAIEPAKLTDVIVKALRRNGMRGLLATGGGAIEAPPPSDDLFVVKELPHDIIFGRVHAAVHHGGAGTTAAALRAGIPCTICPFFGDQMFWGHRVASLGVGPTPLARAKLDVETLARALKAMNDPLMRAKAEQIGYRMRAEGGAHEAVRLLDLRVSSCKTRTPDLIVAVASH